MTDCDWLLSVLSDGGWHTLAEIHRRSDAERGHGLTVHSRASQLRKRGHTIEQKSWRASNGRVQSSYRLVSLEKPDVSTSTVVGDPTSGSSNDDELSLFQIPASARGAYGAAA